jgi:hypothetical protein
MKTLLKNLAQNVASAAANTEFARTRILAATNDSQLARYGRLEDLKIDLKSREISVSLRLHGEPKPVALTVRRYELLGEGEAMSVSFQELETNREWLQNLADDVVVGREFPIPAEHVPAATRLRALLG